MSSKDINLRVDKEQAPADCHLLPCKIDDKHGQQVKAREYFLPTIRSMDDSLVKLASFRGRPLQGTTISVPNQFRGHVINKKGDHKHFDKFSYWNWDELPSKNDSVVKALGWLNVAKAIHDPVDD